MTLEQLGQVQQRKQQSLLEEQIQLEQTQRMRQQRELQLELAKHRNAILEQQHQQQLLRRREHEKQLQEQQQENKQAHRSMFGYRGPEHRMALSTTSEAATTLAEDDVDETLRSGVTSVQIPFMIPAESRVQLAMMDYTPKQIDAMTPEEAQAILSCPSPSSLIDSYTLQEGQCDVNKNVEELTEAIAGARVLSSSSASAAVADISLGLEPEGHRYTLQASMPVHEQGRDAEGHVAETPRREPRNPTSPASSTL
ncbi:hypothetical protein BGZ72_008755 [Mortierella alpina]|nr:hypothetical protein BGZ72_008755 [Mortierella alpina]